jgi:hypothetical protein
MSFEHAIRIRDVTKRFGPLVAVDRLSLEPLPDVGSGIAGFLGDWRIDDGRLIVD